jgi:hypothetical protein
MLRITMKKMDGGPVLTLEGCLAGAWVNELGAVWREAAGACGAQALRVDLRDVCHVDGPGRELMTLMFQAGTQFLAGGCVMPEVVREIAESADRAAPPATRN